jgi:hypothetical protein
MVTGASHSTTLMLVSDPSHPRWREHSQMKTLDSRLYALQGMRGNDE